MSETTLPLRIVWIRSVPCPFCGMTEPDLNHVLACRGGINV